MHEQTIEFLAANMKEMEIELRAHSIALDAMGRGIIEPEGMRDALDMARNSEAMLDYVDEKYRRLRAILPMISEAGTDGDVAALLEKLKPGGYMH